MQEPLSQLQADPDLSGPELAIIVPVFNEVENVGPLSARLEAVLGDVNYEIIFVDDASPDGTADRSGIFQPETGASAVWSASGGAACRRR